MSGRAGFLRSSGPVMMHNTTAVLPAPCPAELVTTIVRKRRAGPSGAAACTTRRGPQIRSELSCCPALLWPPPARAVAGAVRWGCRRDRTAGVAGRGLPPPAHAPPTTTRHRPRPATDHDPPPTTTRHRPGPPPIGARCNPNPRKWVSNIRLGGDRTLIVRGRPARWDQRVATPQLLALPSHTALLPQASSDGAGLVRAPRNEGNRKNTTTGRRKPGRPASLKIKYAAMRYVRARQEWFDNRRTTAIIRSVSNYG